MVAQGASLARALMMPRPHDDDREERQDNRDDRGSSAGRHAASLSEPSGALR